MGTKRKLDAAHLLIQASPDLQVKLRQWKNTGPLTLYAQLAALGYAWDARAGEYYCKADKNGTMPKILSVPLPAVKSDIVLVRMIAHSAIIDKTIADFSELCEALNYHISESPRRYGSDTGGDYVRVYFRLTRG